MVGGKDGGVILDRLIATVALVISLIALWLSIYFWRRTFRPIITAAVRTHQGGNVAIAYDLRLHNSGSIPAKEIRLTANESSVDAALGEDATPENRSRWLACFSDANLIHILQNGESVSCSFGYTRGPEAGFWKYRSTISIKIEYKGWFGKEYTQTQEIKIVDSGSFTGFMWDQ